MPRRIINMLRNHKEWLQLHGAPFLSRSSDEKLFARYAMSDEAIAELWESDPDALYVEPIVGANAVVLDVGANLGTFCYTVQRTNQPVRLVAFEPIPVLAKRLRALFKSALVLEVALSNVKTLQVFRIPFIDGRRCNSRGSLAPIVDTSTYSEIMVQTDRLDNVFPSLGLPVLDFVKIDVEGHELEVVKGGEQTLRRHRPIMLIEIEQRHHGSEPIATVWNFIEGLGYAGLFLNRLTLRFDTLDSFRVEVHQRPGDMGTHRYVNNFLFVPRGPATESWRERLTTHLGKLLRTGVRAST